jgi:hypothetical protein
VRADFPHTAYRRSSGVAACSGRGSRGSRRTSRSHPRRVARRAFRVRNLLGRRAVLASRASCFSVLQTQLGVVRSGLAGHSLTRSRFLSPIEAGALPSRDVLRRRDRRYYGPLGLPLRGCRLRLRLIRRASPRRGLRRRVSRVPRFSLNACCSLYPAGARCALWCSHCGCCLRRDVSGSASGLFLCRGCRIHLMLRPAFGLPPKRLLTPRFGVADLSADRRPASRRTSAYRGGACTRWRSEARTRRRRSPGITDVFVTTHHGPRVRQAGRGPAGSRMLGAT